MAALLLAIAVVSAPGEPVGAAAGRAHPVVGALEAMPPRPHALGRLPTPPAVVSPIASASRAPLDPRYARGKVIEISIARQRLTAWENGRVRMEFAISTGRPGYRTPRGHFRVIYRSANAWSSTWGVWMPWAMNWYGNYFIHQLPHYPGSSVDIGARDLGKPVSHGCVRVGVLDAERVFRWTPTGTPVWVH